MAMKNKKSQLPSPFAAETRDQRFEGTFEVLVPVPNRNKPVKAADQFDTLAKAQAWMHTPDGEEAIEKILKEAGA
jgi:hypothetical protein